MGPLRGSSTGSARSSKEGRESGGEGETIRNVYEGNVPIETGPDDRQVRPPSSDLTYWGAPEKPNPQNSEFPNPRKRDLKEVDPRVPLHPGHETPRDRDKSKRFSGPPREGGEG